MPIPELHFDDETEGLPRQPVPLRYACLAADWTPSLLVALLANKVSSLFIDGWEYDSSTGNIGLVLPKTYGNLLKLQTTPLNISSLPANHFIWSDDFAKAYSQYIDESIGREEAASQQLGIRWNPSLGENYSLVDDCPDLSHLRNTSLALPPQKSQPKRNIKRMTKPLRSDDWFIVIEACIKDFELKNKFTPSEFELWQNLHDFRHATLGIVTKAKTNTGSYLMLSGAKNLGRQALSKRYKRLYP